MTFKKSSKGQSNIINNQNNLNKKSKQKTEIVEVKNNRKLTYKLEFELKNLPAKINSKEEEIKNYSHILSDPDFYLNEPDLFNEVTKKLELAKKDLEDFETRWLELEEIKN